MRLFFKPNCLGAISSGLSHRSVPPSAFGVEDTRLAILSRPKSARRARGVSSISIFAFRVNFSEKQGDSSDKKHTPLRSPWTSSLPWM